MSRYLFRNFLFSGLKCLLSVIVLLLVMFILAKSPAHASSCNDIEFIFARGSGESLDGPSYMAWQKAIKSAIGTTDLQLHFYELGSEEQGGHQYPAVAVSGSAMGIINMVGAAISGGSAFQFGGSVKEGILELQNYYQTVSKTCSNTKFVLGGYSQGAMVMSNALPLIDANKIVYVTTFGDPKLYLPEGKNTNDFGFSKIPDACYGRNLSNYREYVPDCYAYTGVLGANKNYQPSGYTNKLGAWCNGKDIMCSSGMDINDHTSYITDDYYGAAAFTIAAAIAKDFPGLVQQRELGVRHQTLFMIDNTKSMEDTIEHFIEEAKRIAKTIIQSGGQVALYSYGDFVDPDPLHQLCDFSCSYDEFAAALSNLELQDGQDLPESVLGSLYVAMNDLTWSYGANKTAVILTDDGFHSVDTDERHTTLGDVVNLSREIDPVNIYTIGADASLETLYAALNHPTGGKFYTIDDASDFADQILNRPLVSFAQAEYYGSINESFTFDIRVTSPAGETEFRYDWDLDKYTDFEKSDRPSPYEHWFSEDYEGLILVRVTDASGRVSTATAYVNVSSDNQPYIPAEITAMSLDDKTPSSALLDFSTTGDRVLLSIGDAVMGFVSITDGQGEVLLEDLVESTSITLTPFYNAKRGISCALSYQPAASIATNPSLGEIINKLEENKPPTLVYSNATSPVSESSPALLPLAPNTGVANV